MASDSVMVPAKNPLSASPIFLMSLDFSTSPIILSLTKSFISVKFGNIEDKSSLRSDWFQAAICVAAFAPVRFSISCPMLSTVSYWVNVCGNAYVSLP